MSFSRPGALDLSALARPAGGAAPGASSTGGWVVDATEADFQQVALEASLQHLVVLSLWSPRARESADFNARLGAAANAYDGQLLLVQVDVDANPGIAQALGAQAVPLVVGLVKGQPVPLFQSAVPDDQIRGYFDELIRLGAEHGVTGRAPAPGDAAPAPEEPEDDPRFAPADAAFNAGDLDGAIAAYEKLAAQSPGDAEVAERLAGVRLMARTQGVDLQQARAAAADAPADVEAQLLVADLDVSGGHVDDAFDRLIQLVARTAESDRDRVRERLLELFTVVGGDDPRVATARRRLATALY
ncbi:MAG: tetratricopeptide repeat protein [Aeromicrobium sp.]|mgnify:CR=1 FL=1|uniref:tetratricopeptide repeat protein n=1 Tax=Aeromicrobium sp. TaxID=1871063 RepID=UPI0025BC5BE9|nr:tetratricopeptide repeat protein [Aeromicrobium sp.]MCK5891077.1 tetratricopeptide repeat protein [Aeromicrobium sp.]MDF1704114.1 tetratricopeptide repeat protein [Aeromicrobium sp.]